MTTSELPKTAVPGFVYFDLGNVLLNFDHRRGARQMAAVAGVPEETIWNAVFASDLQLRYEAGAVDCRQFCDEVRQAIGRDFDRDALLAAAGAIFELNLPMVPLVAAVQAAGYPTGVLSNTCKCHWDYCIAGRYGMIPGAFRKIVLSYEAGAMKPDRPIYDAAIREAGIAAERIFFIDDREENVAGALAAGIDAVLYRSARRCAAELRRRGVRMNY